MLGDQRTDPTQIVSSPCPHETQRRGSQMQIKQTASQRRGIEVVFFRQRIGQHVDLSVIQPEIGVQLRALCGAGFGIGQKDLRGTRFNEQMSLGTGRGYFATTSS
jgi:hypothetical protein